MLDVAAVALFFLRAQSSRARREAAIYALHEEAYARLAGFLAGLHDLGKFTRNFQWKRDDLWPEGALGLRPAQLVVGLPHWRATAALLGGPLNAALRRYTPRLSLGFEHALIAAIAGHHGRPPKCDDFRRAIDAEIAKGEWIDAACVEAARAAFRELERLVAPAPCEGLDEDKVKCISWSLSGLITLADWIGSDVDHFGPTAIETPIEDYWRDAQTAARRALGAKGLIPLPVRARLSLGDIAPRAASTPRPMQSLAETIPLSDGAQLLIVEDTMGSGKTEAAILIGARMMAAGHGEGLYIALPTMATANAMHGRLSEAYKALFAPLSSGEEPSLILSHGGAELARALSALRARASSDEGEETAAAHCNAWIADDRRRAFFAEVGVGTVDQAFLAVLPKKHLTLRQYALAGRILIIDEAHCFDSYMKEELSTLIKLHAMNGGSTIVLSATLSQNARRKMAAAFFEGLRASPKSAIKRAGACASRAYPMLTAINETTVAETPSLPADGLARRVAIVRLDGRPASYAEAVTAAARGAAVLVLCNAVDEAVAALEALSAERGGDKVLLFHARFAQGDRLAIESEVLRRFGRDGDEGARAGWILVATQVVEQSLDLDFDLVISDLAPVDLLIQRAGRLWRHMDRRPAAGRPVEGPRMMIVSSDPERVDEADWLGPCLGKAAAIYQNAGVMWRSARAVFSRGHIDIPGDLRPLVEEAYAANDETLPTVLMSAHAKGHGQDSAAATLGAFNVVDLLEGYGALPMDLRQDEDIGTRLGEETLTLRLARRVGGSLVPWFDDPGAPRSVAWALSEVKVRVKFWGSSRPPTEDEPLRQAAMRDWPEWEQALPIVEVSEGSQLRLDTRGFGYTRKTGLMKSTNF